MQSIAGRRAMSFSGAARIYQAFRWLIPNCTPFEYWQSCHHGDLLPARKDIDFLRLKPVLGHTHLVDVSAANPADYRFRLYGSKVRLERFRNYTNLRVGDYPSEPYREALMEDYACVVSNATPLYQHIVALQP